MANKINITAELNAATKEGKIADAAQIYDGQAGKFQGTINKELTDGLEKTITSEDTDMVVESIEEGIVHNALRKNKQILTEAEKYQARHNISAITAEEAEKIAQDKINETAVSSPDKLQAVKELSSWLEENPDSAATMNADIQENAADIQRLYRGTGIDEYPKFSTGMDYAAGAVVLYDGVLFRFKTDHAKGEWDYNEVEEWSEKKEREERVAELGAKAGEIKIHTGGLNPDTGEAKEFGGLRCRTDFLFPPFYAKLGGEIEARMFKYQENGMFVGANTIWKDEINIQDIGYKYKLAFRKKNLSAITVGEVEFEVFRDCARSNAHAILNTEKTIQDIIAGTVIPHKSLEAESAKTSAIADQAKKLTDKIQPADCAFFKERESSNNVVDWADLLMQPWSLNSSNVSGDYYATDYIPVKPNTTYTTNFPIRILLGYAEKHDYPFDPTADRPPYVQRIQDTTTTFTTSERTEYVRLQLGNGAYEAGNFMMVEGDEVGNYEPYTPPFYLPEKFLEKKEIVEPVVPVLPVRKLTSIGSSGFDIQCGGQYLLTEKQKEKYGVISDLTVTKVLQVLLGYDIANVCAFSGNASSEIFFKNGLSAYIIKNNIVLPKDKSEVSYEWNLDNIEAQMTENLSTAPTKLYRFNAMINGYNVYVDTGTGTMRLSDNLEHDVTIPAGSYIYRNPYTRNEKNSGVVTEGIEHSEGLLLQIGANSEGATPEEICEYFDLAIKVSGCKWFIAMRQNRDGSSDLNKAASLLSKKYGSRYIDHLAYLKTLKALHDQGLTPTTSESYPDVNGENSNPLSENQIANNVPCDMECIATNKVPSSFWKGAYRDNELDLQVIDYSHFNAQGLECLGKHLYGRIKNIVGE